MGPERNSVNGQPRQASYQGTRTLVLGAGGFIGGWVARKLFESNADVVLQVRDRSTAELRFAERGITGEICELDLYDFEEVRALVKYVRPSIVFNLAGYGIDRTETDEDEAFLINCELVKVLAEAVSDCANGDWNGQQIVHVGSAMEYGRAEGNLNEETEPQPTTVYGRSKLAGSVALAEHCGRSRSKGLTARCFAVYGPGESDERLLPSLIAKATLSDRISLTAGIHKRDFTYVEDVAEGLLRLGSLGVSGIGTVNLCTGKLTSVRTFVETAAEVLQIDSDRLGFGDLDTRPEEMHHKPVTIAKLREMTAWSPRTTISEGVERTFALAAGSVPCPSGATIVR